MIYLWEMPENCTNKLIAEYDREHSPDRFLFLDGVRLANKKVDKKIIFVHEMLQAKIGSYDCIPNNSASPLVNQKIVDLLLELAPADVQFFDTEVHCKNGILTNYKLLNVTSTIVGIDHEKSIYTKMSQVDAIAGFRYLTYRPGCMGHHKIARDEEYPGNLLVTEEIKQVFEKEKIKGMRFARPEDFYANLYR
ncbi:imm11 family protein [Legionella fairfieldensis]|uniref:imm11 family protein n=1 Tax=Legionella fairfieldensis TaxID=45064 RepID=UPI00048FEAE9|nr:DUF1629 domain-containing protein [Legionella fairfieldensis]